MDNERNLVFETGQAPRGNVGAIIAYLPDEDRGVSIDLVEYRAVQWHEFSDGSRRPYGGGKAITATVSAVRRMVNGERVVSAWFPRLEPKTYIVSYPCTLEYEGEPDE